MSALPVIDWRATGQSRIHDFGVVSFGPGKEIDAGEGGVLLCKHRQHLNRAISMSQHPIRQIVAGVTQLDAVSVAFTPSQL